MYCIRKFIRDSGGAVSLETLFLLPLYFMMLGGGMWLDELVCSRCQMVSYGNACSWIGGNWHYKGAERTAAVNKAATCLIPQSTGNSVSSYTNEKNVTWWKAENASSTLKVTPSALAKGLFSIGFGMSENQNTSTFSATTFTMSDGRRMRTGASTEPGRNDCVGGDKKKKLMDGGLLQNQASGVALSKQVESYASFVDNDSFFSTYLYHKNE